jgi:transposase
MGMQRVQAGVDVSLKTLSVSAITGSATWRETVPNDAAGHRTLIARLRRMGKEVFVALEATGNYGLDLAVALHTAGIEVMVINPRAVTQFAKALLQRSKTDRVDADVILQYLQRMPFERWTPPPAAALALRSLSRHIQAIKAMLVEEKNRLHAAEAVRSTPAAVLSDLRAAIRLQELRIKRLEEECLAVITTDGVLRERFQSLTGSVGFGSTSAIKVLGELAVLPADMTARQWTAHAGLDPRRYTSGTSVEKPDRISKAGNRYLRGALYLPAVTAIRCNTNVKAFYEQLVGRGKKPIQAQVAVMRKLLHCIHAMFRDNSVFDGEKFYSIKKAPPSAANAA